MSDSPPAPACERDERETFIPAEMYRLSRREFEIIAALRQVHFFEGLKPRTAVVTRNDMGKPVVLDCQQIVHN